MVFIRYKKFGKQYYAYEIQAIWDKEQKKIRQKSVYKGVVVDKEKKIFEKRRPLLKQEKLILDFGDSFALKKYLETTSFIGLIQSVFKTDANFLLTLLFYRLCYSGAMQHTASWYAGNYVRVLYPSVVPTSQRISEFFAKIGEETLYRDFFQEYFKQSSLGKEGIIIDGSSLPNQIHMPFSQWGRSGEEIDKQIRFLLVVDKKTEEPLFFRYVPGSILDVSCLKETLLEMKKFQIKQSSVCIDAGFFSEDNIKELFVEEIDFVTRLPKNRVLYTSLINNERKDLEKSRYGVKYGKRGLFVKKVKVKLFEKDAWAYIILDPERKGRETKRLLLEVADETINREEELDYQLDNCGIMVLVSSSEIPSKEIVQVYYLRQTVEKLFGFSKEDLEILPLRVHSEKTLRGFLLLQFIALSAFVKIKKALGEKYSVEELILIMRNLKCKVFENEMLIQELSKEQKEIMKHLDITVPKSTGI